MTLFGLPKFKFVLCVNLSTFSVTDVHLFPDSCRFSCRNIKRVCGIIFEGRVASLWRSKFLSCASSHHEVANLLRDNGCELRCTGAGKNYRCHEKHMYSSFRHHARNLLVEDYRVCSHRHMVYFIQDIMIFK